MHQISIKMRWDKKIPLISYDEKGLDKVMSSHSNLWQKSLERIEQPFENDKYLMAWCWWATRHGCATRNKMHLRLFISQKPSSHMAWRSSHTFHPRWKNNVVGFCHETTKRMCTFSQYKPGGCAECPEKQENYDKGFQTQKRQNRKNCFDSTPDQGVTIVPGPRTAWALWFFFLDVCGDVSEPSQLHHVSTVTSLNFQSASMDDKSGSVTWPSPCCWASFLGKFLHELRSVVRRFPVSIGLV